MLAAASESRRRGDLQTTRVNHPAIWGDSTVLVETGAGSRRCSGSWTPRASPSTGWPRRRRREPLPRRVKVSLANGALEARDGSRPAREDASRSVDGPGEAPISLRVRDAAIRGRFAGRAARRIGRGARDSSSRRCRYWAGFRLVPSVAAGWLVAGFLLAVLGMVWRMCGTGARSDRRLPVGGVGSAGTRRVLPRAVSRRARRDPRPRRAARQRRRTEAGRDGPVYAVVFWAMIGAVRPRGRRAALRRRVRACRGWVAARLVAVAAGLALHTVLVAWRWVATGHVPTIGNFENALVGGWFIVGDGRCGRRWRQRLSAARRRRASLRPAHPGRRRASPTPRPARWWPRCSRSGSTSTSSSPGSPTAPTPSPAAPGSSTCQGRARRGRSRRTRSSPGSTS